MAPFDNWEISSPRAGEFTVSNPSLVGEMRAKTSRKGSPLSPQSMGGKIWKINCF